MYKLKRAMAPGSYLTISHVTGHNAAPDMTAGVEQLYEGATVPSPPDSL